jgi:hypothetical protein
LRRDGAMLSRGLLMMVLYVVGRRRIRWILWYPLDPKDSRRSHEDASIRQLRRLRNGVGVKIILSWAL